VGRKTALVDYNLCRAEECGTCAAAAACNRKLLVQEVVSAPPMADPYICRGCGDCVRACPLKAVVVSSQ
jgi:translation initiation factor RLI1